MTAMIAQAKSGIAAIFSTFFAMNRDRVIVTFGELKVEFMVIFPLKLYAFSGYV
ncbi:hypothetical protein IG518_12745 [Vibrio cholerae]|nr:hypothetical protein [Vibrio cholerae]